MKTLPLLLPALALCCAASIRAESATPPAAFQREPAPPACRVSTDLFWVADTKKMDAFLETVQLADVRYRAYAGEVLPDTRTAWRDYALEATALARQGKDAEAAAKLGQMLKLAAVYSEFGGLQNVVQAEEIRHLAGVTSAKLGTTITSLIRSPHLEKEASDCLVTLEAKAGGEKNRVTPSFWRNLERRAVATHYRLSAGGSASLAVK